MANYHYWYMFRVASQGNDDARRQSIYDAIVKQNPNGARWAEPTSSGLIESGLTAALLAQTLSRGLDGRIDLLVVVDLHNPADAAYFGVVEYPNVLKHFVSSVVKVT